MEKEKSREQRVADTERDIYETLIRNRTAFASVEETDSTISFIAPVEDLISAPFSAMLH